MTTASTAPRAAATGTTTPWTSWSFAKCLDAAFLTGPFVTESPLLHWGLPLSRLTPGTIFSHARSLLAPRRGMLLVSCPDEEELAASRASWTAAGFSAIAEASRDWPRRRVGALLRA
jgi:hypothetical protein